MPSRLSRPILVGMTGGLASQSPAHVSGSSPSKLRSREAPHVLKQRGWLARAPTRRCQAPCTAGLTGIAGKEAPQEAMRRPQTRPSILPGLAAVGWRHYDKLPTYSRRHQSLIRASPGGRSGVAPAIRGLCTGRTSDTQESLGGKIAPLHLHPACQPVRGPRPPCCPPGDTLPRCRCASTREKTSLHGPRPPHGLLWFCSTP